MPNLFKRFFKKGFDLPPISNTTMKLIEVEKECQRLIKISEKRAEELAELRKKEIIDTAEKIKNNIIKEAEKEREQKLSEIKNLEEEI
ncbi:MAG TPA: hypothetical protein PLE69_00790, partial [bacterium]|nr:hypothetical protein [bacterium]